MWNSFEALPDVGRKFIALYSDGSGALLMWRHDAGCIDAEGDDRENVRIGDPGLWTYLPDDFEFWCEGRTDEPVTLRIASHSRQGD